MTKLQLPLLVLSIGLFIGCGGDDPRPPAPGGAGGSGGSGGTAGTAGDGGSGAGGMAGSSGTGGSAGNSGTGGNAGEAGTGMTDAEVPFDAGLDSSTGDFGTLSVAVNGLENMNGKQIIVELFAAATRDPIGGLCAPVTSDDFSETLVATTRTSVALCDYTTDDQLPAGNYVVVLQVQEPEIFPAIACNETTATVVTGEHTVVTFDRYAACGGGVRDGVYEGSGLTCSSTMLPIQHTSTNAAASALDFDNVTVTAERDGAEWSETYEDDDCQLVVTHQIADETAESGVLTFSMDRSFDWTPANCKLTVTGGGQTAEVGASNSSLFNASSLLRIDDIWFYSKDGLNYRFSSVPGIWTVSIPTVDIACDSQESFSRTWTLR